MDYEARAEASEAEERSRQQARQALIHEYTTRLNSRQAARFQLTASGSHIPRNHKTAWAVRILSITAVLGWFALGASIITFGIPTIWILHNRHWPRRWYGNLPTFPAAYGRFTVGRINNMRDATLLAKKLVGLLIFVVGRVTSVLGMIAINWVILVFRRSYAWTYGCITVVTRPFRLWLVQFRLAIDRYYNRVVSSHEAGLVRLGWLHFWQTFVGRLIKVVIWSIVLVLVFAAVSSGGKKAYRDATEPFAYDTMVANWPDYIKSAFTAPPRVVSMIVRAPGTFNPDDQTCDTNVYTEAVTVGRNKKPGTIENMLRPWADATSTATLRSRSSSVIQAQQSKSTTSTFHQLTSAPVVSAVTRPPTNSLRQTTASRQSARSSRSESAKQLPTAQAKRNPLEGVDTSGMSLADMEKLTGPLRFVTVGYSRKQLHDEEHAYCSLCRQSHAHEVMIAEMEHLYDWQM